MLPMSCPNERTLREELFNRQVETLLSFGWHTAFKMTEREFRLSLDLALFADLLREVGEVAPGNIPFLLVIPHARLPIERQLERLVLGKKRGYASLDCAKLWNLAGIGDSDLPYLICDVEDGAGSVGKVTADAVTETRLGCRSGLVFEEGIALAVHSPESLIRHAFAMVEVDYRGESPITGSVPNRHKQCVPELWLGSDGPTQSYSRLESRREDRGVPSCKRRLFLDRRS